MSKEMMNEMDKSEWLHKELKDGGLRQILWEVCSASKTVTRSGTATTHQEELLQTMATTYPNVRVFLDKLKVLTGVLERQKGQDCGGGGGEEEEDLKYWLEREGDDLGPLALKPIRSNRDAALLLPLSNNNNNNKASPSDDDSSASSGDDSSSASSSDGSDSSSESE